MIRIISSKIAAFSDCIFVFHERFQRMNKEIQYNFGLNANSKQMTWHAQLPFNRIIKSNGMYLPKQLSVCLFYPVQRFIQQLEGQTKKYRFDWFNHTNAHKILDKCLHWDSAVEIMVRLLWQFVRKIPSLAVQFGGQTHNKENVQKIMRLQRKAQRANIKIYGK